jgi:methionine synthase II (cobalamin-independent)
MPGADPREAAAVIAGELPDFPHLAELPARGPGADMTGRTAAILTDMPVEVTPRGWRLTDRPGRDVQRARSMLSADLDTLEQTLQGYAGPLKVQLAGPWTLAATLEQPRSMNRALADAGAVADIAASLAETAVTHLADVAKRVPGADLVLQLDEPALAAVATGRVPTASGYSRIPPAEEDTLAIRLQTVLGAITTACSVVHCCDGACPFRIIERAGADAVSTDLSQLGRAGMDALAAALDAGLGLLAGVPAPAAPVRRGSDDTAPATRMARTVADLWHRTGLDPRPVVITPPCGLAGASPSDAVAALRHAREAARILPEMVEGER